MQKKEGQLKAEQARQFMDQNKAQAGVITLASGLQYKVIAEGTGPSPSLNDRVRVHYHGTLPDGTIFDSSRDRNEPAVFGVTEVIRAWTEALQIMKVGSRWMLYVPPELGYGERGSNNIGPNEPLIFDVELLEINPQQ